MDFSKIRRHVEVVFSLWSQLRALDFDDVPENGETLLLTRSQEVLHAGQVLQSVTNLATIGVDIGDF